MLDHDTAVASSPQAIVPSESIERVKMSRELLYKLRVAQASIIPLEELDLHHIVETRRVFPCVACGMPVAAIEFSDRPGLHTVDAIPDTGWAAWTVDLLSAHACRVNFLWDCELLLRGFFRTNRWTSWGRFLYPVQHVWHCGQCGELVAPVCFDNQLPIELFVVEVTEYPAEMFRDRKAWPTEYDANLARLHHCPESRKEVRQ